MYQSHDKVRNQDNTRTDAWAGWHAPACQGFENDGKDHDLNSL